MRLSTIKEEIEKRNQVSEEIRTRIENYVYQEYGIPNFWGLVESFIPAQKDLFTICLARQIPTADIENLALEMTAKWMTENGISTEFAPLSFIMDSFFGGNPEKKHYVKLRLLKRGRNALYVQGKKIASGDLDGAIICKMLMDGEERSVLDYHFEQREKAGMSPIKADFSLFFRKCVESCLQNKGKSPRYVFVEREDGKEQKIAPQKLNGHRITRPPAEWYYPLYFFCFLDGRRALLETIDGEPSVERWFKKSVDLAEEVCGVTPLIFDVPEEIETSRFKSELFEIPTWVFNTNWQRQLEMPPAEFDICEAQRFFGKQLIEACSHFES